MSAYRYGLHRVANGSIYSDTASIQEAVWLEDCSLAVGYTGFSSFAPKRGIIRMYERVFTEITYQTFISPPASADNFSFFGTRLATSGNFLASAFTLTNGSGGVAIFEATNSNDWALRDVVQADVPGTNNNFGAEIHMSGDWLAVGDNSSPGGIYLFKRGARGALGAEAVH